MKLITFLSVKDNILNLYYFLFVGLNFLEQIFCLILSVDLCVFLFHIIYLTLCISEHTLLLYLRIIKLTHYYSHHFCLLIRLRTYSFTDTFIHSFINTLIYLYTLLIKRIINFHTFPSVIIKKNSLMKNSKKSLHGGYV